MATIKQRAQFFRLWAKARADVCEQYGLVCRISSEERQARHRWIREKTGSTENINAVRPGNEFSRLMLETAMAACDFREAAYWEMDVAKRWRWFMRHLVRQIGEITRRPAAWEYVQGIFGHLGLPASWEDIPTQELEKVWQMLDTHRRRLLKRDHGWQGLRASDRDPLGFLANAQYVYGADGKLGFGWLDANSRADAEAAEVEIGEEVMA